jgi:hypothetical protein
MEISGCGMGICSPRSVALCVRLAPLGHDRQTDMDGSIRCSSLTPEREEHLKTVNMRSGAQCGDFSTNFE